MKATVHALLLAAPLVCAGGCAARGGTGPAVPVDFALELVVGGAPGPESGLCPGRYIVFCDGALHYARDAAPGSLPPRRRTLTRRELAALWDDLRRAAPQDAAPPTGDPAPASEGGSCVAIVTARGRRTVLREAVGGEAAAGPLAAAAARLAELAWAEPAEAVPARAGPRPIDYGPDPYARYRR